MSEESSQEEPATLGGTDLPFSEERVLFSREGRLFSFRSEVYSGVRSSRHRTRGKSKEV